MGPASRNGQMTQGRQRRAAGKAAKARPNPADIISK